MSRKNINTGAAMLQPGRRSANPAVVIPVMDMPMVLTLDQWGPNPDNPRKSKNPRYEDIKESIRARGLDTVPKVTRDPEGGEKYIVSDGGNTRHQVLTELWQETGDEKFYRTHVLVKPWPGRLQCLIGHLVEGDVKGEISFIEKAIGVHNARVIHEQQLGKSVSLRDLSEMLTQSGLPVHYSTISRMEDALKFLNPWMPELLASGLGRPQINLLLALRQDAQRIWDEYILLSEDTGKSFDEVFGECCKKFNDPELWSPDMFRDEFIGDLLNALPHPDLNYDRWVMELDPKERNRRMIFGENKPDNDELTASDASSVVNTPITDLAPLSDAASLVAASPVANESPLETEPLSVEDDASTPPAVEKKTELQPDLYGGSPVISGDVVPENNQSEEDLTALLSPEIDEENTSTDSASVWAIPAFEDNIEHLQNQVFMTAWEIAEFLGCDDEILPDRESDLSAGYCASSENCSEPALFLLSLTGHSSDQRTAIRLDTLLIGHAAEQDVPVLDDVNALKVLRLIRLMRRLRELQRSISSASDIEDGTHE